MKKFLAALLFAIVLSAPALAAQGTGCMPTVGVISGLTFVQDVNAGIAALISSNSGNSAPATDCSAVAVKGQVWLDTSVTPNIFKMYDGTSWVPIGILDATNHIWDPPIGGGTATIASAALTDLWSTPSSVITISGTATITSLANSTAIAGTSKVVIMGGAATLTHNPVSMIVPGGINLLAQAGDKFIATALSNNNVALSAYTRADGSAIVNSAIPLGTVFFGDFGTIPAKTVYAAGQALSRATYPAYTQAVSRTQSGTLTAGSATITGVANTQGLGLGTPLEGTGINAGTTVSSVTPSTIVMSANAVANGPQNVTAFLTGYGSGGNGTTVGAKDCRGRLMAGRDDLAGPLAGNLSAAYFGNNYKTTNGTGGAESFVLGLTNLPTGITFGGTLTMSSLLGNRGDTFFAPGGLVDGSSTQPPSQGQIAAVDSNAFTATITFTGLNFFSTTSNNTSGAAHRTVQPTNTTECVVQVLP